MSPQPYSTALRLTEESINFVYWCEVSGFEDNGNTWGDKV